MEKSNWDASSQYTDNSVIIVGGQGGMDPNGSFLSEQDDTSVRQHSSSGIKHHSSAMSFRSGVSGGKSHVRKINNDFESQGGTEYGDEEGTEFLEGASEDWDNSEGNASMHKIKEKDEENSFEEIRKTLKKPKSLDDFDGTEETAGQDVEA